MLDTFYSNWSKLIAEARLLLCDPLPQPQKEKHIFLSGRGPRGRSRIFGQSLAPEGTTVLKDLRGTGTQKHQ